MSQSDHEEHGLFSPSAGVSPEPTHDRRQRTVQRATDALKKFSLNDEQRHAVDHTGSPLIVLAGPGTGKTRTIIARILRLLADGVKPESILAMTFTNKAAGEMTERLEELVGPDAAGRVQMGTFHAFGARLISRYADMLGLPERPEIMDSAQRRRMLRKIIEEHGLYRFRAAEGTDALIEPVSKFIEACCESARSPQDALDFAQQWNASLEAGRTLDDEDPDDAAIAAGRERLRMFVENARAYELFVDAAKAAKVVSFSDFITLPTQLIREHAIVRNILRDEIRHVVVDEFQDVNAAQIEMLRQIIPPAREGHTGPDLCIVGDDDQAIYAFRGSDPKAFARFRAIWTNAEQVELSVNYRSRPEIISVGNTIISAAQERFAPDKQSRSNPDGPNDPGVLQTVEVQDDKGETGQVIAAMIRRAVRDAEAEGEHLSWSSFGIIARTNGFADDIAAELRLNDIPVDRRREVTPLDDPGVYDILAWVRLLLDPADEAAVQRLLVRWPQRMNPDRVRRLTTLYRRAKSVNEPNTESFAGWIEQHIASEPQDKDAELHTFFQNLNDLRTLAATGRADEVLEAIIRRSNLMHEPFEHASEHPGEQRARRVENLVQMIRFARERLDQFDQPPTLESFWNYYQDLDEKEQQFSFPSREDLDEVGGEEDRDAVTVISAHKAKGLEFDTVFVVRVRSPHGFPYKSGGRDEPVLPTAFTDRPEPDLDDEERRLFFVSCTRAERRLVLIAKHKKSKSSDFYIELTDGAPHLGFEITDAGSVLDTAEAMGLDALSDSLASVDAAKEAVNRTGAQVWEEATGVLHALDRAGLTEPEIRSLVERLASTAKALPAVASIRSTGQLPAELAPEGDSAIAQGVRRLAANLPDLTIALDCTRPMPSPLQLSYSKLVEFEYCPRCFYVKYVLGLDEQKTTALSIGDITHKALELFYRRVMFAESEGQPLPGLNDLQQLATSEFEKSWPAHLPMDRSELDKIHAQLELAHRNLHRDTDETVYLEQKVSLPYTLDGVTHTIQAKIDRVDRLPEGGWRVIDYKTGNASKKLLEPKKDDLQLCIYAMALPRLLDPDSPTPDEIPAGVAEYWVLSTGQRGTIGFDALKLDKVRSKIDAAITDMLAGHFPRKDKCKGLCSLIPA
ncbi:MAG: ATP-dependent helicase [Phycisphaerales bacterium JB065]